VLNKPKFQGLMLQRKEQYYHHEMTKLGSVDLPTSWAIFFYYF